MEDSFPQDRFLRKDANQGDQTKSAVYTAANPAQKKGDDSFRKTGRPTGNEEDNGAPNVLTGTVIVSCFIQTSALPSRIEMQGNDLTFFDDTISKNGEVQGDTSRLIFTHASAKKGDAISSGFILQKRALTGNTYDNVLELFSPNNDPNTNFVFIGRMGTGAERNISDIEISPDHRTATGDADGYVNGIFRVRVSRDGADLDYRDGVYIFDRGTESSSREGTVNWFVAAGEGGQTRMSYMASRSGNPLTDSLFDIYVTATGINLFGLPTSAPASATALWNHNGVINIGPGGGGGNTPLILTLTATPAAGATSITFSSPVAGLPSGGYYLVGFNGSGEVRSIFLFNGMTTATWTYPLQTGAGTNQVTVHLT